MRSATVDCLLLPLRPLRDKPYCRSGCCAVVLADDVIGACDTALAFALDGLSAAVVLPSAVCRHRFYSSYHSFRQQQPSQLKSRGSPRPHADVLVIDTESKAIEIDEAARLTKASHRHTMVPAPITFDLRRRVRTGPQPAQHCTTRRSAPLWTATSMWCDASSASFHV